MSELQNPLFDEEKEFLERKKLEYERALRGDVEHIKDQSVMVGKVALVGAGLAGGIWLITKAFGGKKRKRNYARDAAAYDEEMFDNAAQDADAQDDESGAEYYTAGNGKRYKSTTYRKSAADSAQAFAEHSDLAHEADDLGFGSTAPAPAGEPASSQPQPHAHQASAFAADDFEDDPFQDLPYDDSRRLAPSHAFDEEPLPISSRPNSTARMVGAVLQSFLQSDTGKVLMGQVAAVGLALVTKKMSEFFPAAKNSDLATSSDSAPAETGFMSVASPASPDFPDASTHPQSL